jgi:hypothetical protein
MIWSALVFGFFSVFGWNTGQKVWDKYVEPTKLEQTEKQHE